MRVLVAENNQQMLQQLCDLLEKEGFEVIRTDSGAGALDAYQEDKPDFMCLDVMMDDMTGFDVCREIRKSDTTIPIIFITAKTETVDKVVGLELGADDYITKPYDHSEVAARVRAVARRCIERSEPGKKDESFRLGDLTVYPNQLKASRGDQSIELNFRDMKILKLFSDHPNSVVHRDELLDHCWGTHIMPESRTVDWHISQLRKKIEKDPANPEIIKTVHGAGYKFQEAS